MKTIAFILVISLVIPNVLFAAPPNEIQPSIPNESRQAPPVPKVDQDSDYSPRAEKAYLGTGIGTLLAGGSLLALGVGVSNENGIGAKEVGTFFSAVGGAFLVASTVLWILYFREKGKEPPVSVSLDIEKGKGALLANVRF